MKLAGGKINDKLSSISKNRKSACLKAACGLAAGLLIAAFTVNFSIQKTMVYIVKVNNKVIGCVRDKNDYNKVLSSIGKTDGSTAIKNISYKKTLNTEAKLLNCTDAEKSIRQDLNLKMPAVILYADGVQLAKLSDGDDVTKFIQKLKQYYYPQIDNGTYKVISSKIKETLKYESAMVKPEEVQDVDAAVANIVKGRGEEREYTIQKGDTLWDIALKEDVDVTDIQSANPKLDVNKIKPGQVIKLSETVPYVNVELVADIKSNESIPYSTSSVIDKTMAKGKTKIEQQGRNGISSIEKTVTILNDDIVSENVTKSTVVTPAVNRIIASGSKVNVSLYAATGRFMLPSRGMISSPFGRRWGKMHEGVDIAAPRGTTIVAADSGKVAYAGWRNGYGLCVMINHGHGLQTLYGHASKLYVKVGQSVKKGQKIAAVGSTGHSTGPHCHFEVRKNGSPVNPLKYVK